MISIGFTSLPSTTKQFIRSSHSFGTITTKFVEKNKFQHRPDLTQPKIQQAASLARKKKAEAPREWNDRKARAQVPLPPSQKRNATSLLPCPSSLPNYPPKQPPIQQSRMRHVVSDNRAREKRRESKARRPGRSGHYSRNNSNGKKTSRRPHLVG
jgi:hypothetical protein